jgi:ATP-dependent helicase/nuclease subunit A
VARGQRRELIGEELRILYVAMTRACQRLILVGSASETAARETWPHRAALTDRWLLESSNALSWIGAWFPQVAGQPDWASEPRGQSRLARWELVPEDDPRLASPAPALLESPSHAAVPAADRERRIREWVDWRYPHSRATTTTAKETVSALRAKSPGGRGPGEPGRFRPPSDPVRPDHSAPAAERGTAHHVLLQMISLDDVGSQESIEAAARDLERRGVLTPGERAALDLAAVGDFWRSEAGRAILAHRDRVQREMPFTLRLSVADMRALTGQPLSENGEPTDPGEFIVLQGVVDLAVLLDGEIWLLDFKTDAVPAHAEAYRLQVDLYARALERIYRRPVTRRWLHFLSARATVEISPAAGGEA